MMARFAAIVLFAATLCAIPARAGHASGPPKLAGTVAGSSAHSEPAADALVHLNLIGRWANDCGDPVRKGISYQIAPDGTALFGNTAGTHRIVSVASTDGRTIVVTIKFLKPVEDVRINVLTMVDNDTYVPTENRNERNEYTVRDGILLHTGQKMPELHRCAGQRLS